MGFLGTPILHLCRFPVAEVGKLGGWGTIEGCGSATLERASTLKIQHLNLFFSHGCIHCDAGVRSIALQFEVSIQTTEKPTAKCSRSQRREYEPHVKKSPSIPLYIPYSSPPYNPPLKGLDKLCI